MKEISPCNSILNHLTGHAAISKALEPYGIGVATGEHCQNRVIFKQFFQANGFQFCQIDSCRMGGLNEVLAVLLMAAKFGGNVSDIQAKKSNLYKIKSFFGGRRGGVLDIVTQISLSFYHHHLTIQHSLRGLVGIYKKMNCLKS